MRTATSAIGRWREKHSWKVQLLLIVGTLTLAPSGQTCWWVTQCSTGEAYAADSITTDLGGTPVVLPIAPATKALLTRLLARENARRAAQSPPLVALTLEQYVRDLIVDMVRGYKVQSAGQDHVDACAAFKTLSGAEQATIMTQLGGVSPCP